MLILLREQRLHILRRQHLERTSIASDCTIENEPFLLLKLQDTFFDSAFGNKTHCANRAMLTKTVQSINRLQYRRKAIQSE